MQKIDSLYQFRQSKVSRSLKDLSKGRDIAKKFNKLTQENLNEDKIQSLDEQHDGQPLTKREQKEIMEMASYKNRIKQNFLKRINKTIDDIKQKQHTLKTLETNDSVEDEQQYTEHSSKNIYFSSQTQASQPILTDRELKKQDFQKYRNLVELSKDQFSQSLRGFFKSSLYSQPQYQIQNDIETSLTKPSTFYTQKGQEEIIQTKEQGLFSHTYIHQIKYLSHIKRKVQRQYGQETIQSAKDKIKQLNKKVAVIDQGELNQFYKKHSAMFDIQQAPKNIIPQQKCQNEDEYKGLAILLPADPCKEERAYYNNYLEHQQDLYSHTKEIREYNSTKSLPPQQLKRKLEQSLKKTLKVISKNIHHDKMNIFGDVELDRQKMESNMSKTGISKMNRVQSARFYKQRIQDNDEKAKTFEFLQKLQKANVLGKCSMRKQFVKMKKVNNEWKKLSNKIQLL